MYFRLLNLFLFFNLAFFQSSLAQVSVVPPVTAIRPIAAITVSPVSALPPVTANKVCAANPAGENECFNYIRELAEKDQCLASRLDRKKTIAQSICRFKNIMQQYFSETFFFTRHIYPRILYTAGVEK